MSKFEFVLENDEAIGRLARVTDRTKCQVIRDALSFYQYVFDADRKTRDCTLDQINMI